MAAVDAAAAVAVAADTNQEISNPKSQDMKKTLIISSMLSLSAAPVFAQGAFDALTTSQTQLRGTARYMSMGGAFGALGGDLSTLTQNPAGIGVYRSSDVGATLDITASSITLRTGNNPYTDSPVNFACDNFGYVGAARLDNGIMPYFNWGVSYNRVNSFNRYYRGYFPHTNTSWSNYVASLSQGWSPATLLGTDDYNPYYESDAPWSSIIAYNSYLMNMDGYGNYVGLFQQNSVGDASVEVNEKGYVDEYSINFGGNFANMVYWGIGVGITELNYSRGTYYDEKIKNALVPTPMDDGLENGNAEWGIDNIQSTSGTGVNLKLGVIVKPINELRFGLAVHTPTWYHLTHTTDAIVDYGLGYIEDDDYYTFDSMCTDDKYYYTQEGVWRNRLRTPWRMMASAAGVIGGRFIISADYVYERVNDMKYTDSYGELEGVTNDIKQYFKPSNELRLGAEFRVTPSFSLRAGYAYKSTAVQEVTANGGEYIYTAGTQSMYETTGARNNVSFGLGYRSGGFYIDGAYVYSRRTSQWNAFSPSPLASSQEYALAPSVKYGPSAPLTEIRNNIVLTVGFRF